MSFMLVFMVVLFLVGYLCIALEHTIKVDKAATALLLGSLLWTCYVFIAPDVVPELRAFGLWLSESADTALLTSEGFHRKIIEFVTGVQIIEHLGDIASTLFFLMGAMTIVELIDVHGGFNLITSQIKTRNKRKLLWALVGITFVMSAVLDNLTTTIVMIMLLRKLAGRQQDRWMYSGIIVIAANSGGAFSPIGDVTTIMLWVKGNVTAGGLIPNLILPSLVSVLIPTVIMSFFMKGRLLSFEEIDAIEKEHEKNFMPIAPLMHDDYVTKKDRLVIFILGLAALLFVPVFKTLTHLPPFVGVLLGLGVLWVYTELMYHRKKDLEEHYKHRITKVLSHVDMTTILFFLGILFAVAALQCAGILDRLSTFLDDHIGSFYVVDFLIGCISSVVDNVPLVAGAMGMYDVTEAVPLVEGAVGMNDIAATGVYAADGAFWLFLAYCAGVGGSMLIIGSAAGVMAMGLEKIDFMWYLRHISWIALLGYVGGAVVFVLQESLLRGIALF